MNRYNIQDIVAGCKNGDKNCQETLYILYKDKMINVCKKYIKSHGDSEDIVQECFLKLFNKINKYKNTGSFEGWMRRVFVNHCLDELRKKNKVYISIDEVSDNLISKGEVDDEYELRYLYLPKIWEHIDNLSPSYKNVFTLYYLDELTHKEISHTLNISEGASKSNLHKAKNNLRKLVFKN